MFEKIKGDILVAMKEKNKEKLDTIRMLKSAVMNEQIKKGHELSDDEVLGVIKSEVKKRKSSIEEYTKYGKDEMVKQLTNEVEVLSTYLPEELSDEALEKIVDDTIKELNADSIKMMGAVIKAVGAKVGAAADMGKVSKMVKEKLA